MKSSCRIVGDRLEACEKLERALSFKTLFIRLSNGQIVSRKDNNEPIRYCPFCGLDISKINIK